MGMIFLFYSFIYKLQTECKHDCLDGCSFQLLWVKRQLKKLLQEKFTCMNGPNEGYTSLMLRHHTATLNSLFFSCFTSQLVHFEPLNFIHTLCKVNGYCIEIGPIRLLEQYVF